MSLVKIEKTMSSAPLSRSNHAAKWFQFATRTAPVGSRYMIKEGWQLPFLKAIYNRGLDSKDKNNNKNGLFFVNCFEVMSLLKAKTDTAISLAMVETAIRTVIRLQKETANSPKTVSSCCRHWDIRLWVQMFIWLFLSLLLSGNIQNWQRRMKWGTHASVKIVMLLSRRHSWRLGWWRFTITWLLKRSISFEVAKPYPNSKRQLSFLFQAQNALFG